MRIISQNVCLGIKNKINTLRQCKELLSSDIIFIQEAEIHKNDPDNVINIRGYDLYKTSANPKSRMCAFIKTKVRHKCVIASDVDVIKIQTDKLQVFGVYRPFKLPNGINKIDYLNSTIQWISNNLTTNRDVVLIGDFNLDYSRKSDYGYANFGLLQTLLHFTDNLSLSQKINSKTWSRIVLGNEKSSVLDHIYTNNENSTATTIDLNISDHLGVSININYGEQTHSYTQKRIIRNWSRYSQTSLLENIHLPIDRFQPMTIDEHEDYLSLHLLQALNKIAPERKTKLENANIQYTPKIRRLKLKKANILKHGRRNKNPELIKKAREIDKDIRNEFNKNAKSKIRNVLKSGKPEDFWKAVNLAKGDTPSGLPQNLFDSKDQLLQNDKEKADAFSNFFQSKENTKTSIKPVYNGKREIYSGNRELFTSEKLERAIKSIKPKQSFGFDRVPMKILKDTYPKTKEILLSLFQKIESQGKIPQKWKISRIAPLPKKGDKTKIDNYRPISNLCSLAKIMEKMILENLNEIAQENNIDLTGTSQYGFKKNSSTALISLVIQEKVAKFLDRGSEAGIVSLDLTAAFDLVVHDILIERLEILGIPDILRRLIEEWLKDRSSYVEIGTESSQLKEMNKGTVQGSVLGPVLFALYIRPLFDIIPLLSFADDGYMVRGGEDWRKALEEDVDKAYEWLTGSGLLVNETKTEFTTFSNSKIKPENQASIKVNGKSITSKAEIKVLGVVFDDELKWTKQCESTIKRIHKLSRSMFYLSKYFNHQELTQVLKSQLYSGVYYNAAVWMLPTLHSSLKRRLISASTGLIRSTFGARGWPISSIDLHRMAGIPMPEDMMNYVTTRTLHGILNQEHPPELFRELANQAVYETRTSKFYFVQVNKRKSGMNAFQNRCKFVSHRLGHLNWMVPWPVFKKIAKKEFNA